jgi:hypothetical protein
MITLDILNKEKVKIALNNAVLKEEKQILKEYKKKDVQKVFISDLKQRHKRIIDKEPHNFFMLNELNNYNVINKAIEISEKEYFYFLEVLSPKYINNHYFGIKDKEITNAFCVSEANCFFKNGICYNAFFETKDNKYYCASIIISNKKKGMI